MSAPPDIVAPRASSRDVSAAFAEEQAQRVLGVLLDAIARGAIPVAVRAEVAARMLGVSVKMLGRLGVPSVRLGHRTRLYPLRQFLAWVEARVE